MSSADRVGRTGHGQLIGSPITLALLGARGDGHLAVPVRQRFTLGTLRLELIPSGRGLGATALWVDAVGRTALYAGPVRTTVGGAGEPAEVRACDALVVAAPVGAPHHRFAPVDDIAAQVIAWARAQLAARSSPVLVVDTATDGIEVATRLVADGLTVAGARSLRDAVTRLHGLAPLPPLRAVGREPCVTIRVDTDRPRPPTAVPAVTALVSARAIEPLPGWDATFAWPFIAGHAQLLAWIEQARAKDVFVTGDCAEAIVARLGPRARLLGPPRQMTLFPREAAR